MCLFIQVFIPSIPHIRHLDLEEEEYKLFENTVKIIFI